MKLKFTWTKNSEEPQAMRAGNIEVGDVSPLVCLLMDDGGLEAQTSLAWMREGIARVDALLSDTGKDHIDWDREAWGASIAKGETTVYSLHDEQFAETIPTVMFRRALVEWLIFFEGGSGSNDIVVDLNP